MARTGARPGRNAQNQDDPKKREHTKGTVPCNKLRKIRNDSEFKLNFELKVEGDKDCKVRVDWYDKDDNHIDGTDFEDDYEGVVTVPAGGYITITCGSGHEEVAQRCKYQWISYKP